jgi:hypothetical protein
MCPESLPPVPAKSETLAGPRPVLWVRITGSNPEPADHESRILIIV